MATALLFPGQGSPAPEWREVTNDLCPGLIAAARNRLDGDDPFDRFGQSTKFDQAAIYCASLAAFELAGRPGADFHAGHSLGEIAALACAGAFAPVEGLGLVIERGRLMAAAADAAGDGAMLAVGASAEELSALLGPDLVVANLNSPKQTVLSGSEAAVAKAERSLREAGTRTKRLPVSGAFHSPAMAPAAEAFARVLGEVEIAEPSLPVISGRTGKPFSDIRAGLAAALVEPVRWIEVVETLARGGVTECREIGPGRALSGLVRRTASREIEAIPTRLPEATSA